MMDKYLEDMFAEAFNKRNAIRHSGRTTRLADYYVQKLFQEGFIAVKDHYDSRNQHEALYHIIIRRLNSDHKFNTFEFDHVNFCIKLLYYSDGKPFNKTT